VCICGRACAPDSGQTRQHPTAAARPRIERPYFFPPGAGWLLAGELEQSTHENTHRKKDTQRSIQENTHEEAHSRNLVAKVPLVWGPNNSRADV